jgi:hypothetical protein
MKCRRTIFHSPVGLVQIHKNHVGTRYVELVFFHPVCSVVHVVHSDASKARHIETLFFMLEWDRCGFDKNYVGTR